MTIIVSKQNSKACSGDFGFPSKQNNLSFNAYNAIICSFQYHSDTGSGHRCKKFFLIEGCWSDENEKESLEYNGLF